MNTMDLFSLKGKNVLITGGRAMYGQGCTLALADAGANIYLASHSVEAAQGFVDELREAKHTTIQAVAFDQTDIGSIERMVDYVIKDAGSLDVFVHCSRILPTGHGGVGWSEDEEALAQNIAVNSAASLYLLELVGKQMIAQKSGTMVVFGSMMGLVGVEKHNYDGNPQMAVGAHGHCYSIDKSGLTAWVRHAASYYGQYGVRINALCPGGLQSPRTNAVFAQQYSKHTQLGRLANGDDIKGPLLFLASDASSYLTGLSIPVDGGYTCI